MALNDREKAFVDKYFECKGNCKAAAIAAGYAESTAENASEWINKKNREKPVKKNVYKPELVAAIDKKREELESERIADAKEVLETVTSILRQELEEEIPTVVGTGNGCAEVVPVTKKPSVKDVMSAATLLARILGLDRTNVSIDGALPVLFVGEDSLEE